MSSCKPHMPISAAMLVLCLLHVPWHKVDAKWFTTAAEAPPASFASGHAIGCLQVVLSVSTGTGAKPDSGMELDSHLKLKVGRPQSADLQQAGSLANPLAPPEMLLGLKEGDRRLIMYDEKQNLVRAACLTHYDSHALPEAFLHPIFYILIAQAVRKRG
jgi:hypothetical protein